MSGFLLHPDVYGDLDEIWEFIAQDDPEAADRVREEIYNGIRGLVSFTHQGHTRPDLTSRPLRFWRVRNYLIAYAADEAPLWVVAIMHGQRSPRVMAAILRGRDEEIREDDPT